MSLLQGFQAVESLREFAGQALDSTAWKSCRYHSSNLSLRQQSDLLKTLKSSDLFKMGR